MNWLERVAWCALLASLAACGAPDSAPDPLTRPIPGASVVANKMLCESVDDHYRTCTRYVLLVPDGKVTQRQLLATVSRAMHDRLGWQPTSAAGYVLPDEGAGYDGNSDVDGGYINVASNEQKLWSELFSDTGDRRGAGLLTLLRGHRENGITMRIMHRVR